MTEDKRSIEDLGEELKQARDELQVKIHLAAADARDEWEQLEKKWEQFRSRAEVLGRTAEEAAEDVGEALEVVGEELKRGYRKIRSLL
jgi:predicted  nucleic acid-binding Zn-ribbon protein